MRTPQMNLIKPTIGVDSGLTWENGMNSNADTIDQHNHSNGQGALIPSSGIGIASALSFNNQQAIGLQATVFTNQSSLATLNALYTINGDLYFNDGFGDAAIRITSGGAVAVTSSGITGAGNASAAFTAGVLIVNSAINTPGNIKAASILLGNITPGSNYLTLSPPSLSGGGYTVTLPSLPASNPAFISIDASGNMGTSISTVNGITRPMLASVGQQMSSVAVFNTSSATFVNVTNLTVTITTSGRPVILFLQPASSNVLNPGVGILLTNTGVSSNNVTAEIGITGNSSSDITYSQYSTPTLAAGDSQQFPASAFFYMDLPSAGTQTYQITARVSNASTQSITFSRVKLVAYEL